MAFPTTGTLDSFTRADGGLGSNWTTGYSGGAGALSIVSNAVTAPSLAFGDAWWNVAQYGPDTEVGVVVSTLPSSVDQFSILMRLQSPGSAAVDGYMLNFIDNVPNPDSLRFYVFTNNVFTQLGATDTSLSLAAGDSLAADITGATITAWQKTGGTWSSIVARTDGSNTWPVAGFVGLEAQHNAVRLDDFFGGTIVTGAFKVWDGSAWVASKSSTGIMKVWDGSRWRYTDHALKVWDGLQWQRIRA